MRRLNGEAGFTTILDPGSDKPIAEFADRQCCHCGGHFPYKPPKLLIELLTPAEADAARAEGKTVRGFCMNCNGHTCGSPQCRECVPQEQLVENMEKGREPNFRPVVTGSTPAFREAPLWKP